ncbi:type II toxin-antitoxin system RelE/ParE family toxin [Pantoea agglomerans]|uniref:type II toxin-antitoxin system RelE/ParE family toxin n=1 Tax=Enterobacter agglomerans TaxID=549 RepID=UPI001A8FE647|nr:type II toxin-antitoxin system RelE/ParE family toxin [Pantoea agglomerans]
MIKSWKHKGLQKLYEKGDTSGVQSQDAERIRLRLLVIDEAVSTDEFRNYPGFRFHPLKGDRKNLYSITVRANWRITFEFTDGDAFILNLEDFH